MLYEPIKKLSVANSDIQQALAGAERVFEVLDSPDLQVEQDERTRPVQDAFQGTPLRPGRFLL